MTQRIAEGEVAELVDTASRRGVYNIEVEDADVILGRTQAEAGRGHGRRVDAGYKGEIKTLENGEGVYAYAPDGDARVTVKPSGFTLDLFPRRETESPSDRATRVGNVLTKDDTFSGVAAGGNSDSILFTNDTDETYALHELHMNHHPYSVDVEYSLTVQDESDAVIYEISGNAPHLPVQPEPAIPIKPAYDVRLRVYNRSSSSIEGSWTVNLRSNI